MIRVNESCFHAFQKEYWDVPWASYHTTTAGKILYDMEEIEANKEHVMEVLVEYMQYRFKV